jgi:type IV pilus assembly protein PilM
VNNGGPHVLQMARQDLDPGVVVGGELRDPDALAISLRTFFKKNGLPRGNVRLGISNNRIGVRMFEIGGIHDPKQLTNAIRYRAQEVLPIPLEDAVLDYHILGEYTDGEGNLKRRVLLVVAYRDLVDRYTAACKKAGIKLAGIDLEAFAILRALAPPAEEGAEPGAAALVVVSVGHDRTTFAVSDGRACQFTRVLEWGGSSLNSGIARALDLAPSEAEPIKLALSLAEPSIPAGLTSEQADKVREAVVHELQAFARELVSSLQFYQSQAGSLGIGEVVLTGGTAHLPGFAAELAKLIGVRVRVGDPLANVKVAKKVDRELPLGSMAAAIGLGIEN